ncbi:MAG TPA: aminoacyl--tRNA ligase-related protein [Thermoplasmata archaeon]|nr:aminoacyl--tRNA ligase-related protein [Thermoplasmata archaeon]
MENLLEAELTLSGALPHPEMLDALLPELATDAIRRTVGQRGEGALTQWKLHGAQLTLTLVTTGPRPHQTLLALARRLSEELGRRERVGVRTFRAVRYRVRFPLDLAPTKPIGLPLPHHLEVEGTTATLELTGLGEEGLRDNWMDRAVGVVQEKARRQSYTGKEQYWALLTQSPKRTHPFAGDPTEELLKRDWVRSGPTKGKWFLGPTVAHLLRTMDRIAREEVLRPLGFVEVVQPHHDSFDILLKTGHLEGLPGEFYYVTEPKTRDPAAWEEFTDLVKITRHVPEDKLAALVTGPTAVSCYAQCPTIYWWLSGRTIAQESLPLRVFDRTAVSNRYESGGRHGLERVDEFHRIEPVYVGTPEQLVEIREKLLARYTHVFDQVLELEWRTAWVTPFYMQQSGGVGVEDAQEKVKGTIDFEAYLPYRGARETAEWLEFQNLSIVGDKYTKAFTIRTQKGELWSGCSGIGLERWLTAFLAQKGFDPADWPGRFREYVGELPRDIRFL